MSYSLLPLNTGDGSGGDLIGDQFAAGGGTGTVVFTGLCFGALGGGSYQTVDPTHGLPVDVLNTVAITAAALPLPSGAAADATLAALSAKLPAALGQHASAASTSVVLASDQPAVPVDVQGTVPVSLASLPALAAGGALVGQVEITDGANVLGTVAHPLEVTVSNTGFAVTGNVTVVDSVPLSVYFAALQTVQIGDGTHTMPAGDSAARSIHTTLDNASLAVTGTFWPATQPVSLASVPALAAGANNVGYSTPAVAGAATGATPFHLGGSAATTNATSVHAGASTLWDVIAINVSASAPAYLKIYDKASAPTVGTDVPAYVVPLPTAGSANGAGAARSWPTGLKLANGLAYAITGGMADNDATAVAANQVLLSGSFG